MALLSVASALKIGDFEWIEFFPNIFSICITLHYDKKTFPIEKKNKNTDLLYGFSHTSHHKENTTVTLMLQVPSLNVKICYFIILICYETLARHILPCENNLKEEFIMWHCCKTANIAVNAGWQQSNNPLWSQDVSQNS